MTTGERERERESHTHTRIDKLREREKETEREKEPNMAFFSNGCEGIALYCCPYERQ